MTPDVDQTNRLRDDAIRIWQAGVRAVAADRLVAEAVFAGPDGVVICGEHWTGTGDGRICVVGGGKAGTGMALGLEQALGKEWLERTSGWLNVPGNCLRPTERIHLHPARPAGVNEPTVEGQAGTERILEMVAELGPADLCLVLLSGGGSALLPAPCKGITLADKQAVTRFLMRAGATISELNAVRRQLSRIKGGGLLRACRAGRMISLIISDVIGDPLDVIASGPTVPSGGTARDALDVLARFDPGGAHVPGSALACLQSRAATQRCGDTEDSRTTDVHVRREWRSGVPSTDKDVRRTQAPRLPVAASNHIIGNNRTAVDAAAREAVQLGYTVVETEADRAGIARDVGCELARWALTVKQSGASRNVCRISGGEPIVKLREPDGIHDQRGGRNQELVLAAGELFWDQPAGGIVLLSGGTDGEDGPTDAAGAFVDEAVLVRAHQLGLAPQPFLDWNNSYPFFAATGGHLKTGPTFTNVMDLRVVLVEG